VERGLLSDRLIGREALEGSGQRNFVAFLLPKPSYSGKISE
jgi:hypothetical protein